jgi:hypothetical protein
MAAWPADEDEDAEALPADRTYWNKDLAGSHLPGFRRPGATFRGYRIGKARPPRDKGGRSNSDPKFLHN